MKGIQNVAAASGSLTRVENKDRYNACVTIVGRNFWVAPRFGLETPPTRVWDYQIVFFIFLNRTSKIILNIRNSRSNRNCRLKLSPISRINADLSDNTFLRPNPYHSGIRLFVIWKLFCGLRAIE